jgi:hypothetical protein
MDGRHPPVTGAAQGRPPCIALPPIASPCRAGAASTSHFLGLLRFAHLKVARSSRVGRHPSRDRPTDESEWFVARLSPAPSGTHQPCENQRPFRLGSRFESWRAHQHLRRIPSPAGKALHEGWRKTRRRGLDPGWQGRPAPRGSVRTLEARRDTRVISRRIEGSSRELAAFGEEPCAGRGPWQRLRAIRRRARAAAARGRRQNVARSPGHRALCGAC